MELADDPLISPAWLAERLDAPDLRVIDASWFPPGDERDAKSVFAERRIPGAVFFDIDEITDADSPLPHMLPTPVKFASRVRKLGVGDGARVIVYDNQGIYSSARVWWIFRAMGHEDVAVLDGGFPAWAASGHPIETDPPRLHGERHFTPRMRLDLVRDFADMRRAVAEGGAAILDARPVARFRGEAPEPRPGLRGGHMPGAQSLPASDLLAANGTMRSADELRALLERLGVDSAKPAICTCGSGVTAAVIALAFARMGRWDASIYDGSWAEWGGRSDVPVVLGA